LAPGEKGRQPVSPYAALEVEKKLHVGFIVGWCCGGGGSCRCGGAWRKKMKKRTFLEELKKMEKEKKTFRCNKCSNVLIMLISNKIIIGIFLTS